MFGWEQDQKINGAAEQNCTGQKQTSTQSTRGDVSCPNYQQTQTVQQLVARRGSPTLKRGVMRGISGTESTSYLLECLEIGNTWRTAMFFAEILGRFCRPCAPNAPNATPSKPRVAARIIRSRIYVSKNVISVAINLHVPPAFHQKDWFIAFGKITSKAMRFITTFTITISTTYVPCIHWPSVNWMSFGGCRGQFLCCGMGFETAM